MGNAKQLYRFQKQSERRTEEEVEFEQRVTRWARYRGVGSIKVIGYDGIPDRLFFGIGMLFIEFKRPGNRWKISPAQSYWHKKLGANVVVCNDFEHAKRILTPLIPPSKE